MEKVRCENCYLKKSMGEKMRNLRMATGLSLEEVSSYLEMTPGFLGLVEHGRRGLSISQLLKFAEKFEVSADELFILE